MVIKVVSPKASNPVIASFWPQNLDVEILLLTAFGWQPTPFTTFLCKIVSRCNLDCKYCYVYNAGDTSWLQQPKTMSIEVIEQLGIRINEHAQLYGLKSVTLILHGGEPLLAGETYFRQFVSIIREKVSDQTKIDFYVQTNGTLITPDFAETLVNLNIKVGLSLDGPREINDMNRLYHNGKSSFNRAYRGLQIMRSNKYRSNLAGILTTINLTADPIRVYTGLLELGCSNIDLMLPHGNWTSPPPGKEAPYTDTPYADWLIPIFDRWYGHDNSSVQIRFFSEILQLLEIGQNRYEALGLTPVNVVVVESDGQLEGIDTLKSAYNGAASTGLNLFTNSFTDVLQQPGILARQIGVLALHDTCVKCPIHKICGGGYYPHRYKQNSGFKNPSIYCSDLTKLISYIQSHL